MDKDVEAIYDSEALMSRGNLNGPPGVLKKTTDYCRQWKNGRWRIDTLPAVSKGAAKIS